MLKPFAIAAVFGDPTTNVVEAVIPGTWIAPAIEIACAQFVSKYYMDGGKRHALIGISAFEITEEQLRLALDIIEKGKAEPQSNVRQFHVVQPPQPADPAPLDTPGDTPSTLLAEGAPPPVAC